MAFLSHYSSDELSRSLHSATDKLGIEDFRAEQIDALKAFLRGQVVRGTTPLGRVCSVEWIQRASGQGVFVNLPTGLRKSVIFQEAPFCWAFFRQIQAGSPSSIAIVISQYPGCLPVEFNGIFVDESHCIKKW